MRNLLIVAFLLFITACDKENSSNYGQAFAITNCQKVNKDFGSFSKIKLTVQNNSEFTFGCWAYIKIKKGNTIIDNSSVVFSSLNPGESQIEEAWFTKFNNHSEYDKAEVELHWTIDSTGYSRNYTF